VSVLLALVQMCLLCLHVHFFSLLCFRLLH
jgi:hypothetical protein